jgi:hypothetical protein
MGALWHDSAQLPLASSTCFPYIGLVAEARGTQVLEPTPVIHF